MFANFDWIGAMRSSPVMVIIVMCSVVTLGFAFERLLYFWKRRGNPEPFYKATCDKVRNGRVQDALNECLGNPHPLGAVAAEVLKNAHMPHDAIEEKMHIALSEQRLHLERNLGVLGTMGNTAPLIGLLGTVWGIMRAFHDIYQAGNANLATVAKPISEALIATAVGLFAAIPAVVAYNYFVSKIRVLDSEMTNFSSDFLNIVRRHFFS